MIKVKINFYFLFQVVGSEHKFIQAGNQFISMTKLDNTSNWCKSVIRKPEADKLASNEHVITSHFTVPSSQLQATFPKSDFQFPTGFLNKLRPFNSTDLLQTQQRWRRRTSPVEDPDERTRFIIVIENYISRNISPATAASVSAMCAMVHSARASLSFIRMSNPLRSE